MARVKVGATGEADHPDVGLFLTPVSFDMDKGLLTPSPYGMDKSVRIATLYFTQLNPKFMLETSF